MNKSLATSLLRIVVSCRLRYRCLTVVARRMCFGSFHSPFVTARRMSCLIVNTMRRVFSLFSVSASPEMTMLRNFISFAGRTSLDEPISRSSAVGGQVSDLVSLNARWIILRGRTAASSYMSLHLGL